MNTKMIKFLLLFIALGIWVQVFQNFGFFGTKNVKVTGGYVSVSGSVDIDRTIDVNVTNEVDVNLEAINGKRNAFYDFRGNQEYVRIPVYTGY